MKSKKVRSVFWLVAVLILSIGLSACAPQEAAPAAEEPVAEAPAAEEEVMEEEALFGDTNGDGVVKVAYNNLTEQESFFQIVLAGLKESIAAEGWEFLYAEAGRDAQNIQNNINAFVLQDADFIIDFNVLPDVGNVIGPELKAKGIPFLSIDSVYEDAYFFGVNNKQAGEVLGEALIPYITDDFGGEIDFIVHFYVEPAGPEVKLRNSGAGDAIRAAFPDFDPANEIWIDVSATDLTEPRTKMADFLTANPEADKIVAIFLNDDRAFAAFSAVEAAGRVDQVIMGSHNNDASAIEHFKTTPEDSWKCSLNYNSDLYGENIVKLLKRVMAGEDVPQMNFNVLSFTDRTNVFEVFPD